MRVPYSWLKEYVDISLTPAELANELTDAGIEVESIFTLSKGVQGVFTAKVISVNQHPSSERLNVCIVDTGKAVKTIVTAATNVISDAIVAVALTGAVLADGKEITSAQFKGIVSEGMLCSAQELGIGSELLSPQEREGVLLLPQITPLGEDINSILALNDPILELSLTPNRADCLSIRNVAREVSADLGISFKNKIPSVKGNEISSNDSIKIEILNNQLCPRYIGKIVSNIKIAPSPLWLQNRLRTAGVRPINNIVDITNYIMLEYGQPMHAFDYDLLKGKKIFVRNAFEGEKITTLDDIERELDTETLVIADAERAVAIAGIMGGADTEISSTSKSVLLESAVFEGSSIRKNSRKLGLRSEASHRFEKGLDIVAVEEAIERAAELIEALACGEPSKDNVDVFPAGFNPIEVIITLEDVNSLLGTNIGSEIVEKTFSRLQFSFQKHDEKYVVKIPSYRRDITGMVDLVEEVARLYGYNNIPTTLPIGQTTQVNKTEDQIIEEIIVGTLTACGLNEVITYSFINQLWFDKLALTPEDPLRNTIKIQNPLNEDQGVMRTTIVPSLLETVQRNFDRRNTVLNIFEIGKVYIQPMNPLPEERMHLAMFIGGVAEGDWHNKNKAYNFYDLKGIVEELFAKLGASVEYKPTADIPFCHPGRTAEIFIDGQMCGFIGEVHPNTAEKYDFPVRGYICELDVEMLKVYSSLVKVYKALPKYPSVARDLALIVPENVCADEIVKIISEQGGELLQKVNLFDVYSGEQIASGFKSLAYSLIYQSNLKTLTDEEIQVVQERIINALQKFNIFLR